MPDQKKEPMIGKENRPSAVDYNAPVSGLKVGELVGVMSSHLFEIWKPEYYKPEYFKPEFWKPEFWKPEAFKPPQEKEFRPASGINEQLVEQVAVRVIEVLKERGVIK